MARLAEIKCHRRRASGIVSQNSSNEAIIRHRKGRQHVVNTFRIGEEYMVNVVSTRTNSQAITVLPRYRGNRSTQPVDIGYGRISGLPRRPRQQCHTSPLLRQAL